jgi:cytochrome bd ubiquinol oxidase subunit II
VNALVSNGVAGALLLAVCAYSTAGGTDYGAGIWDLVAGRFRNAVEVRALIDHAMAPVWEANNVWLVFAAVICWTGFPVPLRVGVPQPLSTVRAGAAGADPAGRVLRLSQGGHHLGQQAGGYPES